MHSFINRNFLAFAILLPGLLLVGCGCSTKIDASGTSQPDTEVKDGYTLVWSDEFDGGALDLGKWRIETNGDGGGNAELQYYDESGISVVTDPEFGNTALCITARRESRNGKSFVSGRLNTSGKFQFTYGMAEARIRLPKTADGLWPAFWLLGADYMENPWPRCGEIDIMEMGNAEGIAHGTQERFFNGACHWGYYKGTAYPNYARSTTNSYSIQDGRYHSFTLLWDETSVKMYLDRDEHTQAAPYYEMSITNKDDDWGVGYYFHHDFFIILNMAVGGYFTGILQSSGITALPAEGSSASMYVDYVKVYKAIMKK